MFRNSKMDTVEFLMARRQWRNGCLRCNIVPKDRIEMWGKVRLAQVESNHLGKSEHLLREAIQLTALSGGGRRPSSA